MSAVPRFARLLVLIGIVAVAAAPGVALAERVTATLTFQDGNDKTWGGLLFDQAVPADYDGNGTADLAVWNRTTGNWTIRRADGTPRVVQWGQDGDIPIPR